VAVPNRATDPGLVDGLDGTDRTGGTDGAGPPPGQTTNANIAPLCRRHHRIKTRTAWCYTILEPGTFLWRSPHGLVFLRDHTGATPVRSAADPPDREQPRA
jgi:hypothetical protein